MSNTRGIAAHARDTSTSNTRAVCRSPQQLYLKSTALPLDTQKSLSDQKTDKMQLSTTNLIASILCVAVACTAVQSLTILRGLGQVHHAARELKEDRDKFVTDPSANVKGKFPLYCY